MLIKIGNEAYVPKSYSDKREGFRLVSYNGSERHVDIGGYEGGLWNDTDGNLLLSHADGICLVDPKNDFSTIELDQFEGDFTDQNWTYSLGWRLVNIQNRTFKNFKIEYEALKPLDPGYSMPCGITALIPGSVEVLITLSRNAHFVLFDLASGDSQFVELPYRYGGAKFVSMNEDEAWLTNYHTLCKVDLQSRSVVKSNRLQPDTFDGKIGRKISTFIGTPHRPQGIEGWLVPRPYSGDILWVDDKTINPIGRIPTGGRPHDIVEFDNGDLLVLDHSSDNFQTANIRDLEAM